MIYFLQPLGGGPIKIGCSRNIHSRHGQLEDYYGREMVLLGTIPGERKDEQELFRRFAHCRIETTEQFRPCSDLLEFIGIGPDHPLYQHTDNPESIGPMAVAGMKLVVQLKGDKEWSDWFWKYAGHQSASRADLVERALSTQARLDGFFEPPPRRMT